MPLQRRTIQKLFREDFPGTNPLVVDPDARDKVAKTLKAKLERIDGVDTKDHVWIREEEKPRFVTSFSLCDPEQRHHYHARHSFWLVLDNANRLTIKESYSGGAVVSDLEEVVQFVRHGMQRLDRHKALRAKRGKVRDLLSQAILAHVRKLAKEERFDFMSEADEQKLNLFVKLTDDNALVLHVPFKQFKEFLPQLRSAITSLRQLYQSGIRFQVVGRRRLPWRQKWTTHYTL